MKGPAALILELIGEYAIERARETVIAWTIPLSQTPAARDAAFERVGDLDSAGVELTHGYASLAVYGTDPVARLREIRSTTTGNGYSDRTLLYLRRVADDLEARLGTGEGSIPSSDGLPARPRRDEPNT